jgi:hypothetical protein
VIWLDAAILWFLNVDRTKSAIHDQIVGMATNSPHWLMTIQNSLAGDTQGHGVAIATILGLLSIALAAGVWTPARVPVALLGAVLVLAYWVFGQSMGGPFWEGSATDVNSGPLIALLAVTLLPVTATAARAVHEQRKPVEVAAAA